MVWYGMVWYRFRLSRPFRLFYFLGGALYYTTLHYPTLRYAVTSMSVSMRMVMRGVVLLDDWLVGLFAFFSGFFLSWC